MIEADLARHYHGFDLCDLWRGKVTLRKVGALLDGLPPESRAAHAMSGANDKLRGWSLTDQLIGRLHDEVAKHRWQFESTFVPEHKLRKQPKSIIPNDQPEPEPPTISPSQIGKFLGGGS